LPQGNSWFIEARYQHVNAAGVMNYLPIEVGIRF
jgi:hypothetical protein